MPRTHRRSLAVVATALLVAPLSPWTMPAAATTEVTLEPRGDTTIYEGETDHSNGAGEHIFVGRTAGGVGPLANRRAPIRFDVSSIPSGSTITSATLSLTVLRTPPDPGPPTVNMHRLLVDWGEGSTDAGASGGAGATAVPPDATWDHRITSGSSSTGTAWGVDGGAAGTDYVATLTASASDGTIEGLAADVQAWVDGTSNFGWMLIGDEGTPMSVRGYGSRENSTALSRPKLTITFESPPDLTVTKADQSDPVAPNGTITYTVSVANSGDGTASDVEVVDDLPDGVALVNASGSGWTCGTSDPVICTRTSLAGNSTAPTITINATAPSTSTTVTNNVTVSTTSTESNTTNNSDTIETDVIEASVPETIVPLPGGDDGPEPVGRAVCRAVEVLDAAGEPVPGAHVLAELTGANEAIDPVGASGPCTDGTSSPVRSASGTGSATTDVNGVASFSYTPTVTGDDQLTLVVDVDEDGVADASEPTFTYDITVRDLVTRLAGDDRIATAIEIAHDQFASADTAVLALAFDYADGLVAAPLAAALDAPILLNRRDELHPDVAAELERLGATTVVIMGGEAAQAAAVQDSLEASGITVGRIGGADRFATAALVAARLDADRVIVAEGRNADPRRGWPDALSASALAAARGWPILLVTRDVLPDATADALDGTDLSHIVVAGGTAAVSTEVEEQLAAHAPVIDRVGGVSRYETSALLADLAVESGIDVRSAWLATGAAFPDSLSAGPAAARDRAVLLLAHPTDPSAAPETLTWLGDHVGHVERLAIIGGVSAIADAVADAYANVLP